MKKLTLILLCLALCSSAHAQSYFSTGFQIGGAAPSNHIPCGNGTNYVDCGAAAAWTPTITTSGTVGTPSYTTQTGSYEQIGRQVTVRFYVQLSGTWTGSPTGNVSVAGLPVASANTATDYGSCIISFYQVTGLAASNVGVTGFIAPNTSIINLFQASNTATTAITVAQFGVSGWVVGMCSYHT